MDRDQDIVNSQSKGFGCGLIINGIHHLDLQVVVSTAQSAHLPVLPFLGLRADLVWIRTRNPAVIFDVGQVIRPAVSLAHSPGGPLGQELVQLFFV